MRPIGRSPASTTTTSCRLRQAQSGPIGNEFRQVGLDTIPHSGNILNCAFGEIPRSNDDKFSFVSMVGKSV